MHIFIIHYTPLIERKTFMDNQLRKLGLDAIYVTKYDKENIVDSDKDIFDFTSVWANRNLHISNASLILKHLEAYTQIVNSDNTFGLIMEDDVVLDNNFKEKYLNYYEQLPSDWDILFYGDGFGRNMHVPQKLMDELGGNVFLKSNNGNGVNDRKVNGWPVCAGASRCSDCYLINKKAAQKILHEIETIKTQKRGRICYPSDLWMNHLFRKLNFKVYWAEPTISTQGTETGIFKSSHNK